MKICITAKSPSSLSEMEHDFEKCTYFTLFVEGSMGFEATINNKENNPVQLLISKGVNIVITKNSGLQSLRELQNAQIEVFTDSSQLITDALYKFREGKLKPVQKQNLVQSGLKDVPLKSI